MLGLHEFDHSVFEPDVDNSGGERWAFWRVAEFVS